MVDNLDRVVVVTGGSKGIGRNICCSLSNPKTIIYFTYFSDADAAKETAKVINKNDCKVYYKQVDVASSIEVSKFFDFVFKKSKKVDVLVNNAGIVRDSLLVRMSEKNWDRVINVNLKGTFNCIKNVSKIMIKQKYGRIINISSVVGIAGNSGQGNYAASKAGIIGLTKSVAKELGSRNITANVIAPGYIKTDMTKKIDETKDLLNNIPLKRIGTPDDISNVVAFLSSKSSGYITGQVICVDGGMCIQ